MRRVTTATANAHRLLLRRRFQRRLPRHTARWAAGIMLTAGLVLVLAVAMDTSGRFSFVTRSVLGVTARAGLSVAQIDVSGRRMTGGGEVLTALGTGLGAPILGVSLDAARRRLEALPWVRTAAVERRLPDRIHIELQERQPLALWQLAGRQVLIDTDGVVIQTDHIEPYSDLLVVSGDDAPKHAQELITTLKSQPDLAKRVTLAFRVEERRWSLRTDSGIEVKLPESGMAAAWARLAEIERRHAVLQRDVRAIDMRLDDRVVVVPVAVPSPPPGKPSKPDKMI
jgi:cell division protein FtsQ